MILKVLLYFGLLLMLYSCNQDIVYDKKSEVSTPWKYGQKLDFNYEINDTTRAYDLIISLDHSSSFSYENLYLNVSTVFPDGKTTTYPVSFQLTDEKGDWVGACNGDRCITDIEMASAAYFKTPGQYKLILEQYSRNENLDGIYSVRIKVVKSKT